MKYSGDHQAVAHNTKKASLPRILRNSSRNEVVVRITHIYHGSENKTDLQRILLSVTTRMYPAFKAIQWGTKERVEKLFTVDAAACNKKKKYYAVYKIACRKQNKFTRYLLPLQE